MSFGTFMAFIALNELFGVTSSDYTQGYFGKQSY